MAVVERHDNQIVIVADAPDSTLQRFKHSVAGFLAHMVEIWRYRELVRNFTVRDLKVRYRNSALGILWSFGNPLLMMLVFTVVFTVMAPTGGEEIEKFPVFVLCGLLPWNLFSNSVMGSIRSIVDAAPLTRPHIFP